MNHCPSVASALLILASFAGAPACAEPAVDAATAEVLAAARARLGAADLARFEVAISYARAAHDGQVRDGGRPAILHPLRVTGEILKAGGPVTVELLSASMLHDVVEDTPRTLREIRARFGPKVARIVDYVTLGEIGQGGKAARDKAYYERFKGAPRDAQRIKYHDRTDNIRDMKSWPVEGKLGYLRYTRETVIPALRGRSPDLARALDAEVTRRIKAAEASLVAVADRLAPFRRADGTLRWRPLLREGALSEGAGLAKFTLALFLKELAVVVRTGDRLRIEEFFDGLATTDFFVHYGLFAVGARAGEVAYSRYLARFVKPGFVGGLLRTNVVLAAGLALPQIVRGTFDGEAFAISLSSLGLSSTAVRAGLSSLRWVASGTRAASLGLKLGRLAGAAGWVYTVAETAVVLYLADAIEARVRAWKDAREAKAALAEAGQRFFRAVQARDLDQGRFDTALADYRQAWGDYRAFLRRPLEVEEARLRQRLARFARRAKIAADERAATLERLEAYPSLRRDVERRHGSLEAFAQAGARDAEAALERDVDAALAAYAKRRAELLRSLAREQPREAPYLSGADLSVLAREAPGGLFARLGHGRAVSRTVDALADASQTRPGTYRDEAAALAAARRLLGDSDLALALEDAQAGLAKLRRWDRALTRDGAVEALSVR